MNRKRVVVVVGMILGWLIGSSMPTVLPYLIDLPRALAANPVGAFHAAIGVALVVGFALGLTASLAGVRSGGE